MEKEIMIKAIYEKIADKTLSFWCKIKTIYEHNLKSKTNLFIYCYDKWCSIAVIDKNWNQYQIQDRHRIIDKEPFKPKYKLNEEHFIEKIYDSYNDWRVVYNDRKDYKNIDIIWHPVMIWDVLDYKDYDIKSWNRDDGDLMKNLISYWEEKESHWRCRVTIV